MKKTTVTPQWELSRGAGWQSRLLLHGQDRADRSENHILFRENPKTGKDFLLTGIFHLTVLITLLFALTACGKKDNTKEVYTVFYLTAEKNALVPEILNCRKLLGRHQILQLPAELFQILRTPARRMMLIPQKPGIQRKRCWPVSGKISRKKVTGLRSWAFRAGTLPSLKIRSPSILRRNIKNWI